MKPAGTTLHVLQPLQAAENCKLAMGTGKAILLLPPISNFEGMKLLIDTSMLTLKYPQWIKSPDTVKYSAMRGLFDT